VISFGVSNHSTFDLTDALDRCQCICHFAVAAFDGAISNQPSQEIY
jgi:hypothetical protein